MVSLNDVPVSRSEAMKRAGHKHCVATCFAIVHCPFDRDQVAVTSTWKRKNSRKGISKPATM